jgi:predicted CopG family antitoxin
LLEIPDMTKEYKFIRISPETHKELESMGMMRDSFEDVIKKLIKFYKENKK